MASQLLLQLPSEEGQQEQQLTAAQSLALVKIFLNASVACICYTRELLNWQSPSFRTRYIDQISIDGNPDLIYDAIQGLDTQPVGSSQEIRVLVRGEDKKANKLLDMIETGVFEAIGSSYLDVLQIFVTTDLNGSKAIRETYTYSFDYKDSHISSILMGEAGNTFCLQDVQKSFKSAIRDLLRSMKDLPQLPKECALGMSISYKEATPILYEPTGFIEASNNPVVEDDWNSLWSSSVDSVTRYESSYHTVKIGARNSTCGQHTNSQIEDTMMSKQLQAMQKPSSSRNPALISTIPGTGTPSRGLQRATSAIPRRQYSGQRADMLHDRPQDAAPKRISSDPAERASELGEPADKSMQNPLRGLTVVAQKRRQRNLTPEKMAECIVHAYALDFFAANGGTIFDRERLEAGIVDRLERSKEVRCECGDSTVAEKMFFCNLCNTSQHAACYGLDQLQERALPRQHLCYSCVLSPKEQQLLLGMPDLVHKRLALRYLAVQKTAKVHVKDAFVEAVLGQSNESDHIAMTIIDWLVEEGLISSPVDNVARILLIGKGRLTQLQTAYLDPLADISHHYRTCRDADKPSEVKRSLQQALQIYSNGRNYVSGEGVEEIGIVDSTGHSVDRWGYYENLKRKSTVLTASGPPPKRRKLSISAVFINLDGSEATSELSDDGTDDESVNYASRYRQLGQRSSTATEFDK